MDVEPVFDGEWVVNGDTSHTAAIRQIAAYYLPNTPLRVDPSRYTLDRRVFKPGESVWETIEHLAADAGMELVAERGRVWVRNRV